MISFPKLIFSFFTGLLFFILLTLPFITSAQNKTVGITKHLKGGDENGYILFTPMSTDTTYLINKCGKRIHSWYSQYTPGLSVYLKPDGHLLKTGTYTDTVFGFAGGRGGIIEEYDWDGNLVWRYKLFNDSLCQHHDITPLPNGNVLVLAWHAISKNDAIALGRKPANFAPMQDDLWGERILELKPIGKDSAEVVWQWDLFDHIVQDFDSTLPNYGNVSTTPGSLDINYALNMQTSDWIHANGLDYNKQLDQIIISCHNISEIWVIDHSTNTRQAASHKGGNINKGGDFIYRWGNPEAYGQGSAQDRKLFRQHNAHWIAGGLKDSGGIMIFNNGWNRDTSYSSIDIIQPPLLSNGSYTNSLPYGPNKQSWIYKDSVPTRFYSQIISGAQRLPNGNTLICSGVQGRFFEVDQQKKTVWEYFNPRNGIRIQADGETPSNNAVFRCTYYPETYSAFTGRNLAPNGTVELKPYVYSCNYETTPPKLTGLSPVKSQSGVNPNAVLRITFDESVLAKTGTISIYQNQTLYETITVPNANISIANNVVSIVHTKPFSINARIGVAITKGSFRDSSNNLCALIDTATWHFNTSVGQPLVSQLIPATNTGNVSINAIPEIRFNQKILKAGTGEIIIWENSFQKEKIQIGSNQISVSGNVVKINPSAPFAMNANIVIEFGPCFIDTNGVSNNANNFGDWTFKTISLPNVVTLSPANNASGIAVNTGVSITFDRPMRIGNPGSLMIYENHLLKDSIKINGPRAMISGNAVSFDMNADFKKSAYVSIVLKPGSLMDTFGTSFAGIDSANWHFRITSSNASVSKIEQTEMPVLSPNPGHDIFRLNNSSLTVSLRLFDLTGREMKIVHSDLNEKVIEFYLSNTPPGHYLLLINGHQSIPLIVE